MASDLSRIDRGLLLLLVFILFIFPSSTRRLDSATYSLVLSIKIALNHQVFRTSSVNFIISLASMHPFFELELLLKPEDCGLDSSRPRFGKTMGVSASFFSAILSEFEFWWYAPLPTSFMIFIDCLVFCLGVPISPVMRLFLNPESKSSPRELGLPCFWDIPNGMAFQQIARSGKFVHTFY